MRELWDYFWTFFKVGAMTFGGGYAMMPILQREVVEGRGWSTSEEVLDYYAIGQCLPGLNAVNVAIFVGYKNRKSAGAMASALGMVTPSVVIIVLIAMFLENIMGVVAVQNAFAAVRVAVCALVLQAAWGMAKAGVQDVATGVIFVVCLLVMSFTGLSPVPVVLVSGAVGMLLMRLKKGGAGK